MPPILPAIQFIWKFKEEILGALLIIFLWWAWDHRFDQGVAYEKTVIEAASAAQASKIKGEQNAVPHVDRATLAKRVRAGTY